MKSSDEHVRPGDVGILDSPGLKQKFQKRKKKEKKKKNRPHFRNTLKSREVGPQ